FLALRRGRRELRDDDPAAGPDPAGPPRRRRPAGLPDARRRPGPRPGRARRPPRRDRSAPLLRRRPDDLAPLRRGHRRARRPERPRRAHRDRRLPDARKAPALLDPRHRPRAPARPRAGALARRARRGGAAVTTTLVTGAAGFIGFNFVRHLLAEDPGARVVG